MDKKCSICLEYVKAKPRCRKFGILPECNHIFCLECIRRWRANRDYENKTVRACPECRIVSNFVCPSTHWVETKKEKKKLIKTYKNVLSKQDCKYFRKGAGECPFGNKCFYLHALPNGEKFDVGPPPRRSQSFMELWFDVDDYDDFY